MFQGNGSSSDSRQFLGKTLLWNAEFGIDFGAFVVHGLDRAMEEFGDFGAVRDAQFDDGKNAEFHVEPLPGLGFEPAFGTEQRIEILHETGEDIQEGPVEVVIHLPEFRARDVLGRIGQAQDIVGIPLPHIDIDLGAEREQAGNIGRIQVEEAQDIASCRLGGAVQIVVELDDPLAGVQNLLDDDGQNRQQQDDERDADLQHMLLPP